MQSRAKMTFEKINRFIFLKHFVLLQPRKQLNLKQKKPMLTLVFHSENMRLVFFLPKHLTQW